MLERMGRRDPVPGCWEYKGVGNQHRGFKRKKKLKIDLPYDPDIAL